jgi:hypothetical protein
VTGTENLGISVFFFRHLFQPSRVKTFPSSLCFQTLVDYAACEVPKAVVKKNYVFMNIMSCSPLKVNRYFVGTCRLHLQDRRRSHARNYHNASKHACFFIPENGGHIFI